MRSDTSYVFLCFLIVLALYVTVQHAEIPQRDCQQLLANFDRYANTTEWNFGNYQSIPSVWAGGMLLHFAQINGEYYEATLRGEDQEFTFGFIIPAYAASRYPLREMYAFDIGNYRKHYLAMVDSRMPEMPLEISEPELVPVRCN